MEERQKVVKLKRKSNKNSISNKKKKTKIKSINKNLLDEDRSKQKLKKKPYKKRKISQNKKLSKNKELSKYEKLSKNKKVSLKKKRSFNILNFIFFIFVLYFSINIVMQKSEIENIEKNISNKSLQRDALKEESLRLQEDIDNLNDKNKMLDPVERIARDSFKMVKPNETIYIDKNRNSDAFLPE